MDYKVVISYSEKDIELVNKVKQTLLSLNVNPFVASYSVNPGQSLPDEIQKNINGCRCFVLLWSKNSKESDWVQTELGIAKGCGKKIITMVLDPDLNLPGFIGSARNISLFQ